MLGLGWIAAVLFCLGIALFTDGAASFWSNQGDDEASVDGVATAGCGATLIMGAAGAFLAATVGEP